MDKLITLYKKILSVLGVMFCVYWGAKLLWFVVLPVIMWVSHSIYMPLSYKYTPMQFFGFVTFSIALFIWGIRQDSKDSRRRLKELGLDSDNVHSK